VRIIREQFKNFGECGKEKEKEAAKLKGKSDAGCRATAGGGKL